MIGFEIENAPSVSINADLFDVRENPRNWSLELSIFPHGEESDWPLFAEGLTWREAVKMVEEIESGFETARITDTMGRCIVMTGYMYDVWEHVLTKTDLIGWVKVEFWNDYLKRWQSIAGGNFFIDERNT